ncbi:MAG: hypothetical protein P1R58_08860 [bacterium]|nr:hypothetical protein [bacterium]
MPFCPTCRYEYEPNISKCPDCDEFLVSTLPPENAQEEEKERDWVPLAQLTSQQYSQMFLEALRSKGIDAIELSGTGYFGQVGAMGPSASLAIGGGYTIAVSREHLEEADSEGSIIFGDGWEKVRIA